MSALSQLQADVAAQNTAIASAIVLIAGLKTALDSAIASAPTDDSAALQALSASLESETAALSQAVVANTPQAAQATTTTNPDTGALNPAPVIPPTDGTAPSAGAPVAAPAPVAATSVTTPAPAADVAAAQAPAAPADSQRTDGAENGVPAATEGGAASS